MSTAPKRIQLSRRKGWRMPPNTVSVARPGRWGNPYRVGVDGTAAECVAQFRAILVARPDPMDAVRRDLRGKNLACWCRVGDPCHADVLIEVANG